MTTKEQKRKYIIYLLGFLAAAAMFAVGYWMHQVPECPVSKPWDIFIVMVGLGLGLGMILHGFSIVKVDSHNESNVFERMKK